MLNFRANFFFIKFTVLFFILTIFGYWGIDLNSEELYIAFSFFLLVIVGVVTSRQALLYVFIKSVNTKYFRLLSDLLVSAAALTLRITELEILLAGLVSLKILLIKFATFTSNFLFLDFNIIKNTLVTQRSLFLLLLPLSFNLYCSNLFRIKKFQSFSGSALKFFSISL